MLHNRKNKACLRVFHIKHLVFLILLFAVGFFYRTETPANDRAEQTLISGASVSRISEGLSATTLTTNNDVGSSQQPSELVVDVIKDFGATGNGITDDTNAIQNAINTVYEKGGGVIVFPPGIYVVKSVTLKDNIVYQGYGATIKRPARQDKWTRTFTTDYKGKANSKPLIIKGFTFDGNSQNQGAYRNYELEQAHLIFLVGDPKFPGKLQAVVEDCNFKNGVADGISVYTNVDVKIKNIEASDVFRGGFVLTGGNSSVDVSNLTTKSQVDQTGIDIEVDGKGYGNTLKVDVKMENLNLIDGDFDIAVAEGSKVVGTNIFSESPFYLFALNSTVKLTHSKFKVGAADGYSNRILFPHDVTFEDCEFYVTRKETGKHYDFFSGADIWWQHRSQPTQHNQVLTFQNVQFKVDGNIRKSDKTYAIYSREDSKDNNNQLILKQVSISNNFVKKIVGEE